MIFITTIQSETDLLATLALQQENLRRNVPIDEQISDGFVTVEHQPDLLWQMNDAARTIISKNSASELVGYALAMLPEFAPAVPELVPLFFWIKKLQYNGKCLQDYAYYVLGQVCVKKRYRGQKIFRQMLHMHRDMYCHRFQLLITSISSKNKRSLRAHAGVGFEIIHKFHDSTINETWHIVLWDWQK
jgi:GNAT superfamily N-acetyltransferase